MEAALADVDPRAAVTAEVGPADLFMLIFTSGTSGEPKAVLVTHEKVAHPGAYLSQMLGLTADDRFYLAMPMFHSNAVMAGWGPAVACGGAMALAPRFSARGFIDDVRRYGATYMNYVGKPLAYVLVNTSGAGQFAGYYKDEAATAARIRGGMYWSGDLADRDEAGWVYFAGRTSDWLRVDGETSPLPLSSGSCFAIRT